MYSFILCCIHTHIETAGSGRCCDKGRRTDKPTHPPTKLNVGGLFLSVLLPAAPEPVVSMCVRLFLYKLYQYSNIFSQFFYYFRNVLSTSCTTIPLLESPTRETLESIQMATATDGILSLMAMNVVVPCRSSQSFTLEGSIIFSKVIVKTSQGARLALNSG